MPILFHGYQKNPKFFSEVWRPIVAKRLRVSSIGLIGRGEEVT